MTMGDLGKEPSRVPVNGTRSASVAADHGLVASPLVVLPVLVSPSTK